MYPQIDFLTTSLFHFGPSPHHLSLGLSIEPPNQFPRFCPGNPSMSSKCSSQASSGNSQGTAGLSSAQILQRLPQAQGTTARGHPTTLRVPKGSGSSPSVSLLIHLLPPPAALSSWDAPHLCTHLTFTFPHIPSGGNCGLLSIYHYLHTTRGFPGGAGGKEPACQCRSRRRRFNPWVRRISWRISWRRAWPLTPVLWPGESPWTEEPGGLQAMGSHSQTWLTAPFRQTCVWGTLGSLQLVTGTAAQGSDLFFSFLQVYKSFPGGSDGRASAYNAGDPGSIPGSGRSPGEANGNPLQYSLLEDPMDGGAW